MNHADRTPPERLLPLLETAAELRATGNPWAVVAKRVGRAERTVRRWKKRYRRTWQHLYRAAEDDIFAQLTGMAATVMSGLLIDKDDPNRWRNCQFLIGKRRDALQADKRLRRQRDLPQLDRYWIEMIAKVEGKSPQQLEQEILDYAAKLRAPDAAEPAGPAALPGTARPE